MRTFAREKEKGQLGKVNKEQQIMRILCISRGVKYSPNLAGNDAAIFMAVVDELRAMGHEVSTISEEEMLEHDYEPYDRVMTMARDVTTIMRLQEKLTKEDRSHLLDHFVNSLGGCFTCSNKSLVAIEMQEAEVPQPTFFLGHDDKLVVEDNTKPFDLPIPIWLKNSDSCATKPEDTIYCANYEECLNASETFQKNHVRFWLLQVHQPGDLVKFYGVEGTGFFHWSYASQGHSKFGHEKINGKEKGYVFDANELRRNADRFAQKIGVPIYGGDAVIDEKGQCWFIDFNDFPSFSACREEAAKAIAQRIV